MNYQVSKDKEKRKRRMPWRSTAVVLLLLAISGGGMKLGVIPGGETFFGADGIIMQEKESPSPAPEQAQETMIVVTENQVMVDDVAVDLAALEEHVKNANDQDSFQVKDNQAIKETFEQVISILQKYSANYTLVE